MNHFYPVMRYTPVTQGSTTCLMWTRQIDFLFFSALEGFVMRMTDERMDWQVEWILCCLEPWNWRRALQGYNGRATAIAMAPWELPCVSLGAETEGKFRRTASAKIRNRFSEFQNVKENRRFWLLKFFLSWYFYPFFWWIFHFILRFVSSRSTTAELMAVARRPDETRRVKSCRCSAECLRSLPVGLGRWSETPAEKHRTLWSSAWFAGQSFCRWCPLKHHVFKGFSWIFQPSSPRRIPFSTFHLRFTTFRCAGAADLRSSLPSSLDAKPIGEGREANRSRCLAKMMGWLKIWIVNGHLMSGM